MHFRVRRSRTLEYLLQSSLSVACCPNPRPMEAKPVARKALLIGISYASEVYRSKPESQMPGALADVKEMYDILIDKPRHLWPTKANIERAISDFVGGTSSGDICFLFYAGHGHQIYNPSSPETDKRDKHIVPCDAIDPDVMPLVAVDAKLTAVFDCCHSGTVLDLLHYRCNDITAWKRTVFSKTSVNLSLIVPCTLNSFAPGITSNWDPCIRDCEGFCLLPKRRGSGYVICISACLDEELAWGGNKGGSLTRALIQALHQDHHPTLKELNIFIGARVKVYVNAIIKKRRGKDAKESLPKIAQHPQVSHHFTRLCPFIHLIAVL
ncbi:peptidase C14 [Guyanagaster necrorhizus]|uniref:Peptidase C14 n=1 Tax=Guyanagaster necrorhizus TaxID=856835 RepID=A0A9P7VQG7_9AGAR|nr:peptidase C14 [Guyanagaster necrorhizus MCA 3950]KAG7445543.1 peptidase C14 [Guyanagaster necrorhizus MCA 3950]